MDVVCTDTSAFVYVKMFKLALFGQVVKEKGVWENTKIHVKHGKIGGKVNYVLPGFLYHYINSRAEIFCKSGEQLSTKQRDKISESLQANSETFLSTDAGRAFIYDLLHAGDDAFLSDNS